MKKVLFCFFLMIFTIISQSCGEDGFSVPEKDEHEFVDLGLSVYWATCNVGALTPNDFGDYFAWGETVPKSDYSAVTYLFEEDLEMISKTKFDAARVNWGGGWRMPTKEEMMELCEKCTWNGQTIVGPNGKSITLPKAGLISGTREDAPGYRFYYWTANKNYMLSDHTVGTTYASGKLDCRSYLGMPIRPVKDK